MGLYGIFGIVWEYRRGEGWVISSTVVYRATLFFTFFYSSFTFFTFLPVDRRRGAGVDTVEDVDPIKPDSSHNQHDSWH